MAFLTLPRINLDTQIPYKDSKTSDIMKLKMKDILAQNGLTLDNFYSCIEEKFDIDGIACKIVWNGTVGTFCGYITEESFDSRKIKYEPHGGFTAHIGFDCAHCDDVSLVMGPLLSIRGRTSTFKTRQFVYSELKAMIDSINDV